MTDMNPTAPPAPTFLDRLLKSVDYRLRRLADRFASIWYHRRMRSTGARDYRTIKTWTTLRELQTLFQLASAVPPECFALEIGSYLGASSCWLVAGLAPQRASLICVDTWMNDTVPGEPKDTFAEFQSNVSRLKPHITVVRKRSDQLSRDKLPGTLHLVFLDGDHDYESVNREMRMLAPLVCEGGIMAFHDAVYFEGVARTVGEAVAGGDWQFAGHVDNLIWLRRIRWTEPEYREPMNV